MIGAPREPPRRRHPRAVSTDTKNTPIEALERMFPLRVLRDRLRQRSAAARIARARWLSAAKWRRSTGTGLTGCLGSAWDAAGIVIPMEATVDDVGRIVLPKPLRERLRLTPGTKVDVSEYGDGLHVTALGRTARLEVRDGRLVASAETPVTDEDVLALVDAGRR